jgi:hypothetical protein
MEKLKSKSTYIFIAVATISFTAFYLRKKIRRLLALDKEKLKTIQEAIESVRREYETKPSIDTSEMVKSARNERDRYLMAYGKYGHKHK